MIKFWNYYNNLYKKYTTSIKVFLQTLDVCYFMMKYYEYKYNEITNY